MGSSAAVGKASRLTLFRKLPSGQRNNPKEKRQLQPGSTPTSSISAQTGWKPILHYAVASSRWVREGCFQVHSNHRSTLRGAM